MLTLFNDVAGSTESIAITTSATVVSLEKHMSQKQQVMIIEVIVRSMHEK